MLQAFFKVCTVYRMAQAVKHFPSEQAIVGSSPKMLGHSDFVSFGLWLKALQLQQFKLFVWLGGILHSSTHYSPEGNIQLKTSKVQDA